MSSISSSVMINELVSLQEEFYLSSRKNIFFKKDQKLKCAQQISNTYDINDLMKNTCYIINGTDNKIFFDYRVFKLYATPNNYDKLVAYIVTILDIAIEKTGSFEFHINLSMFSVSAAERYKDIIELFCIYCMNSNTQYSELMTNFSAYNTPAMIEIITSILKRWTPPIIMRKLVTYPKGDSSSKKIIELLL